MSKYIMITTACNTEQEATIISEKLLEKHLISCAQLSTIKSSYHWQGKIEHKVEYLLQMKTTKNNYEKCEKVIKELHIYEVPEIVAYNIIQGEQNFLNWINENTKQSTFI